MPSHPTPSPSKPTHLPLLLSHLRTSSSASTPSISLSTDTAASVSTLHDGSTHWNRPVAGPSRGSSHLSLESTSSSPLPRQRTASSTSRRSFTTPRKTQQEEREARTARREAERAALSSSTLSSSSSSSDDDVDEPMTHAGAVPSPSPSRSRSRASSSSSLEGLAARLKGAREGKGKGKGQGKEKEKGAEGGKVKKKADQGKGKEKERAVPPEEEDEGGVKDEPFPLTAADSSVPRPPSAPPSPRRTASSSSAIPFPSVSTSAIDGDEAAPHLDPTSDPASDEEDEDEDEEFHLPSRSEGQPDPRDLLRTQLERGKEVKPTLGALGGMGRTVSGRSVVAREGEEGKETEKEDGGKEKELGMGMEVRRYEPRRYFILSTAGKLVWTSDQDEEQAAGLVGVMQAIVSIFADEGDKIRYVHSGPTRIAFLLKPPLNLVVVSNGWGEPESVLRTHLTHLHLLLLSVVTLSQLQGLFQRRSNADLRGVIEGTEPFFHSLTSSLQSSALALSVMTSSIEVYRLPRGTRDEVARVVQEGVGREVVRDLDLLYVLILAHGRLVTLLRPKKHSIHPTDLHLLLSTIYSTSPPPPDHPRAPSPPASSASPAAATAGKRPRKPPLTAPHAESWFPICLPRFNPRGFLYAYVSFLDSTLSSSFSATPEDGSAGGGGGDAVGEGDGGVGVVVLSSRRDAFDGVKEVARGVKERLLAPRSSSSSFAVEKGKGRSRTRTKSAGGADGGLVHEMEMARVGQEYSLGELALPGLRHFLYKSRALVQVTRSGWEGEYRDKEGEGRKRLITLYQTVHDALHPRPSVAGSVAREPAQVQYVRTDREAVLGWITPTFELYVCTSPLLPHSAVVSAARAVSKWVAREEAGLFLMGAPTF